MEQDVVALELGLAGTEHALDPQVLVHLLQTLEAPGHVLAVDVGVKGGHGLLAHEVSTVDVKARALLDQRHGHRVTQVLLRDVLDTSEAGKSMRARPARASRAGVSCTHAEHQQSHV